MKTNTARWPDHHVEELRRLAPTGLSRSTIAKQLNATFPGAKYTRNAVLSKISRLNMEMSPAAVGETNALSNKLRASSKPAFGVANNCQVFQKAPDAAPRRFIQDPPGLATSDTLGPHMCKWPIGDPRKPDFTFCGRKTDRTYCEEHWLRAHDGQAPKSMSKKQIDRTVKRFAA